MGDDFKILPGQVTQLTSEPIGLQEAIDLARKNRRRIEDGMREEVVRDAGRWTTTVSEGDGEVETHIEAPPDVSDWMTPKGTCQRCGERPATVVWAPDGTMGMK